MDINGNFVWAKKVGGTNYDRGYSLAVDISGNIYTTGSFTGTVDFDPGIGISSLTYLKGDDMFVQKLDSSGNFVWAKHMKGLGTEQGRCIVVDASGYVCFTGIFSGTTAHRPQVPIIVIKTSPGKTV